MSKRSKSQLQKDVPVLVDELPQKIFDVYFSELVEEHTRLFANAGNKEIEKEFKDSTIAEFNEQFIDSLRRKLQGYLGSESEEFEYDHKTMKLALQQVKKTTQKKWMFDKNLNENELNISYYVIQITRVH